MVISCCYYIMPIWMFIICSVHVIHVSSISSWREDALYWPTQCTCPAMPNFISKHRCSTIYIILSYYHIIILSYYHIIILSYYHIIILSYYHIIILSYYHIIILSYYHIIILSYYHIIIL
jgi:hypothetical protein